MPAELDTKFDATLTRTGATFGVSAAVTGPIAANTAAIAAEATARAAEDTAEATARAAADTALSVAVAAAQDDATSALFEVTGPSSVLDLYVDQVAGNDANDGLSTTTPVLTASRLYELIPLIIYRPVLVHMTSGTLDLGTTNAIAYQGGRKLLGFYGDEAWNPRGDLYTTVLTGTAGVGTSGSSIVSTTALTADAHVGQSIRMLTGAAAGQKRTVNTNTTGAWAPTVAFSPAPASGDTYEIFTNNAVIQIQGFANPITLDGSANNSVQGLSFIGVDFVGAGGATTMQLGANHHQFHGCRARSSLIGVLLPKGCTVEAGNAATVNLNAQFGLPQASWDGWGLSIDGTSIGLSASEGGAMGVVQGAVVVSKGPCLSNAGSINLRAGRVTRMSTLRRGASFTAAGTSSALPFMFGASGDTDTKVATTGGDVILNSNVVINTNSATNPAISSERGGTVQMSATVTGSNAHASGLSVRARRRGYVHVTGTPVFGKVAADWQCEGTTATQASLSAADTRIADLTKPDSVIVRYA